MRGQKPFDVGNLCAKLLDVHVYIKGIGLGAVAMGDIELDLQ